jgi:hypothetical protein
MDLVTMGPSSFVSPIIFLAPLDGKANDRETTGATKASRRCFVAFLTRMALDFGWRGKTTGHRPSSSKSMPARRSSQRSSNFTIFFAFSQSPLTEAKAKAAGLQSPFSITASAHEAATIDA